jgi:SAM-dependent methyltransferase
MEEGWAARYGEFERWHWWFRGRERILESVLRREAAWLRSPTGGGERRRVASVGCGPPAGLDWLASALAGRGTVIGLDADPSGALRRGVADRSQTIPSGVAFVYGSLEASPLRSASCDAVLALDVLEHVEDDAAALAQAAQLVRPGGLVLVTVPALPSLWGNQDVLSHHKRRYTARSLARTFDRAGLCLAWQSYFNTTFFPIIAGVRWTRRLLGRTGGVASDFEHGRPGRLNEALLRMFAAERHLIGRIPLPIGVSLIAMAQVPTSSASAIASPRGLGDRSGWVATAEGH